jgi:SM-20-related protein
VLNKDLDVAALASSLSETGRVLVPNVFETDLAEKLHLCLRQDVPWRLAYRDTRGSGKSQEQQMTQEQFAALGPQNAAALRGQIIHQAKDDFQYLYQHFNIGGGQKTGQCPGLFLYELYDYLKGPDFMEFARNLTGNKALNDIYAHATLYTEGNFLKLHEDVTDNDDRRFAYVFGFTRDWKSDMGGLTHFLDENGTVVETLVPDFNTLMIFSVPAPHLVSQVSPWVRQPRYSVTGWLLVES